MKFIFASRVSYLVGVGAEDIFPEKKAGVKKLRQ
jgi:hypothetical protein